MRKLLFLLIFCLISPFTYPETITLKSGKVIEGEITGFTDTYIRVDLDGTPLFYYLKVIESIEGQQPQDFLEAKEVPAPADSLYFDKGLDFVLKAKFDEAEVAFKKSLESNLLTDPTNAALKILQDQKKGLIDKEYTVLLFRGIHARINGEDEKAVGFYKRAIAVNPLYPEAYVNLGNLHALLGQFEEAIAAYEKFIALVPDDADVFYNLGVSYLGAGKTEGATKYFERAIELNPKDVEVYNRLGVMYAHLGDFEKTVEYFTKSLQLNPKDADICFNLGIAYVGMEESKNAIDYFKKAIAMRPDYAEAYASLGAVYLGLDKIMLARRNLEKAKELFLINGDDVNVQEVESYLQKLP